MREIIEAQDIDLAGQARSGSTVLHEIARWPSSGDHGLALSWIALYKPDVNARDRNGWTSVLKFLAAEHAWKKEFFFWLLDNGTDVAAPVSGGPSARPENGITCLHLLIAALQPISLRDSTICYVGPHYLFAIANIPAQADNYRWISPEGCQADWIHPGKRQVQEWVFKILMNKGADFHAVARHWGTPTDIARYTGNFEFWCSVLEDCNINVGEFFAYDSAILRSVDIQKEHEALRRNQENSQVVKEKLEEFWRVIAHSDSRAAPNLQYVPLPLGHCHVLKGKNHQVADLRYLLLRLLSNKRVGQTLLPNMLRRQNDRGINFGLEIFIHAATLECNHQSDVDLVHSSLGLGYGFLKSNKDTGGFEERVQAFLELVRVCQAKASGMWTIEQEKARQTKKSRLNLAEESMLRLLQILTRTVARLQWPDEVMGWGETEDLYPVGNIPGQWEEDDD